MSFENWREPEDEVEHPEWLGWAALALCAVFIAAFIYIA
jgi:hypothetical protein